MDKDKLLAKVCYLLMIGIGALLEYDPLSAFKFAAELTIEEQRSVMEEARKYVETECE